jgi:hypothetical protein
MRGKTPEYSQLFKNRQTVQQSAASLNRVSNIAKATPTSQKADNSTMSKK